MHCLDLATGMLERQGDGGWEGGWATASFGNGQTISFFDSGHNSVFDCTGIIYKQHLNHLL